jgi:hypothetical protein
MNRCRETFPARRSIRIGASRPRKKEHRQHRECAQASSATPGEREGAVFHAEPGSH